MTDDRCPECDAPIPELHLRCKEREAELLLRANRAEAAWAELLGATRPGYAGMAITEEGARQRWYEDKIRNLECEVMRLRSRLKEAQ